jgi:hypothetical protein
MTHDEKLAAYSRLRLGGRALPPDLRTLLMLQWQNAATPLSEVGARLIGDDEAHDLLEHSYLNDDDRANPDIMANVAAIESTCEHAVFVVEDCDRAILGYWFGPENVDIADAPIVKYDTEGQFLLMEGTTVSEALVGATAFEDVERFAELKQAFTNVGIEIAADRWDDLKYPDPPTGPGEFHEQRYEENLGKAK